MPTGAKRFGWVAVSQAASSASNLVIVLAAAAGGDSSTVGAVTLLGAVYLVTLSVGRGLVADPLLLADEPDPTTASTAAGISGVIGLVGGVVLTLGIVPLLGAEALPAYVVGLVLCPLLMQDTLRYVAFRRGRADLAAWSDLAWTLVGAASAAVLLVTRQVSTEGLFLSWCVSGSIAGVWLAWQLGIVPRVSDSWRVLKSSLGLRLSLLADGLLTVGAVQAALVLTAMVAGNAAAGQVRFLQALFGPATILFMALYISSVQSGSSAAAGRVASAMFFKLAATTLVFACVFWVVPMPLGRALFGDTFSEAQALLWPFTAAQLLAGLGTAGLTGLRLAGRVQKAARIRLAWACLLLVGTAAGGLLAGVVGVLVGTSLANAAGALIWWFALHRVRHSGHV